MLVLITNRALCRSLSVSRSLDSLGVGASLAVICTIVVNLSLTPALLLQWPEFFRDETSLGSDTPWPKQLYLLRSTLVHTKTS